MSGFVYAIQVGENAVKIGWSADPVRRLTKIATDCPFSPRLLGIVPAERAQEADIKSLLAPWRIRREWFRIEGPVVDFISMLRKPKPALSFREKRPARTPLDRYMNARAMSDAAMAACIGRERSLISKLRNGKARPSFETAEKIFAVTGGEVAPADFLFRYSEAE